MNWLANLSPVFLFCVRTRYLVLKPKMIDVQPIQRVSECRVIFGNSGRSFTYHAMYRSVSMKIFDTLGDMLHISSHFRNASIDSLHLPLLNLCVHWYGRVYLMQVFVTVIFSWFYRTLLLSFVMMCNICAVVISCACSNTTAFVVLGAVKLSNDVMIHSDSASSSTLRDANRVKVESNLPLLWCQYTCTNNITDSIEW